MKTERSLESRLDDMARFAEFCGAARLDFATAKRLCLLADRATALAADQSTEDKVDACAQAYDELTDAVKASRYGLAWVGGHPYLTVPGSNTRHLIPSF